MDESPIQNKVKYCQNFKVKMRQIYEVKVVMITRGGLAGWEKLFFVVITNCKKSA